MAINSIDLYKGIKELDDPDITLSILDPNINIVQLVDMVGGKFLNGEVQPDDFEEVDGMLAENATHAEKLTHLKEASKKEAVIKFLKTEGGGFSDYIRWATANNHEIGSQTMFSNAKKVFDAQGGVSPSSGTEANSYGISPAQPEEPLYDPEDEDVFEETMDGEAVEKFEELEVILRRMANGDENLWALFVYGSPGVGKSFSMKKVFEEEAAGLKRNNITVVTKTGGIAGSTGLLQLLYDHKKGYVLILDDNDKILSDQTAANYLKGALNTDIEDRHVTYSIADRSALFAQDDEEDEDYEMDIEDDDIEESTRRRRRPVNEIFGNGMVPPQSRDSEWDDVADVYDEDDEYSDTVVSPYQDDYDEDLREDTRARTQYIMHYDRRTGVVKVYKDPKGSTTTPTAVPPKNLRLIAEYDNVDWGPSSVRYKTLKRFAQEHGGQELSTGGDDSTMQQYLMAKSPTGDLDEITSGDLEEARRREPADVTAGDREGTRRAAPRKRGTTRRATGRVSEPADVTPADYTDDGWRSSVTRKPERSRSTSYDEDMYDEDFYEPADVTAGDRGVYESSDSLGWSSLARSAHYDREGRRDPSRPDDGLGGGFFGTLRPEDEEEEPTIATEDDIREAFIGGEDVHIYENEEGNFLFETAKKTFRVSDVDTKALKEKRDKDGESIRDFYFRSRMIFISNLMEVPAAVDDRCYSVDMVFTYEQILELIQNAMQHIDIQGVDMELRMEVLNFLRRSRFAIERKLGREVQLTFRKFRNACISWQAASEEGLPIKRSKSWAMRQLKGAGGKKR
ncbi:MAG: hypothetical protein LC650_02165 [Actinobacteria bacterium]|nr:hypothetical protein [Actinomycetota bacterium]